MTSKAATETHTMPERRPHHSGMLQALLLLKIAERPSSGYALSKTIQQATGKQPSWGSIYPILRHLAQEGWVSQRSEGRKKVYTITAAGKRVAKEMKEQHQHLIASMTQNARMVCEIMGQDIRPVVEVFQRMERGERPLAPLEEDIVAVRNLLFTMAVDGRLQRHNTRIRRMIQRTRQELERLS